MTTNANIINSAPYLRTSRDFPEDPKPLLVEINKSYIDIANAVNNRTISIFPTTRPAITGESWYLINSIRQQSLRQVYIFTTLAPINHGIKISQIDRFTAKYGDWTDGTNFYGLLAATIPGIANQLTFYVTSTQIIFVNNSGLVLTQGNIVLEWLARSNQQTERD